jgi:hypothetical protein
MELRKLLPLLEEAHEIAKAQIMKELPDVNPLQARDEAGRFILLDSLTSIVVAKTAIYEWDSA